LALNSVGEKGGGNKRKKLAGGGKKIKKKMGKSSLRERSQGFTRKRRRKKRNCGQREKGGKGGTGKSSSIGSLHNCSEKRVAANYSRSRSKLKTHPQFGASEHPADIKSPGRPLLTRGKKKQRKGGETLRQVSHLKRCGHAARPERSTVKTTQTHKTSKEVKSLSI